MSGQQKEFKFAISEKMLLLILNNDQDQLEALFRQINNESLLIEILDYCLDEVQSQNFGDELSEMLDPSSAPEKAVDVEKTADVIWQYAARNMTVEGICRIMGMGFFHKERSKVLDKLTLYAGTPEREKIVATAIREFKEQPQKYCQMQEDPGDFSGDDEEEAFFTSSDVGKKEFKGSLLNKHFYPDEDFDQDSDDDISELDINLEIPEIPSTTIKKELKKPEAINTKCFALCACFDSLREIVLSRDPALAEELNRSLRQFFMATGDKYGNRNFSENRTEIESRTQDVLDIFNSIVLMLIRYDKAEILKYLYARNPEYMRSVFENLNPSKIKKGYPHDLLQYSIATNAVKTLRNITEVKESGRFFHTEISINHLKMAIDSQAEECFAYLLSHYPLSVSEQDELIVLAKKYSNVSILNMLFPTSRLAILRFFDATLKSLPLSFNKDCAAALSSTLSAAYLRSKSMQEVDQIAENLLSYLREQYPDPEHQEMIAEVSKTITKARQLFTEWAATRYRKPIDIRDLQKHYAESVALDLNKEMEYGLFYSNMLAEIRKEAKELKTISPASVYVEDTLGKEIFTSLPECPRPKNYFSMRELLYKFSQYHVTQAKNRGSDDALKFGTFRSENMSTSCSYDCRYANSTPLIEAMALCPDDGCLTHHQPYPLSLPLAGSEFYTCPQKVYSLKYKGVTLTEVHSDYDGWIWRHGRCNPAKFWPDVERLHKEVFDMDMSDIATNPEKIKTFYDKVVEVVWLMGNLTPMKRGTGRYVESWLAAIHDFHNLSRPVLKPDLQLDCLNISLSLPVYKKLFLNFFDPHSLDPAVMAENIKRNREPGLTALATHFKVSASVTPPSKPVVAEEKSRMAQKEDNPIPRLPESGIRLKEEDRQRFLAREELQDESCEKQGVKESRTVSILGYDPQTVSQATSPERFFNQKSISGAKNYLVGKQEIILPGGVEQDYIP